MKQPKQTPKPATGYQAKFLDSSTFANKDYRRRWLIDSILVADEAGVIGGPQKTLKTSVAIDMAISLATAKPFLGQFRVGERQRVAVLSGESGPATLQATAHRIAKANGVQLEKCDVLWSFHLPQLSRPADVTSLRTILKEREVKVVFIDPLYLCLLGCGNASAASNLYAIGPLLRRVADACLREGATPIFVHHANKSAAKSKSTKEGPLELDDLAFSGIAEFVRQWVLLSRRQPYQPGEGKHELLLAAGGSAGHSSCWEVDVAEGVLDKDFGGRTWQVAVRAWQAGQPGKRGKQCPEIGGGNF